MSLSPVMVVAMVALGLCIGVMSGLFGIGGGIIMIPAFRLILGFTAIQASATSLFCIILTSITGSVARIRSKLCVPQVGIAVGLGGCLTSPVGAMLAQNSPSWGITLATVIFVLYSSVNIFRRGFGRASKSVEDTQKFKVTRKGIVIAVLIGLITGLASGYVGLGGGFIVVPLLMAVMGMSFKNASGTSLVSIMFLAIPGMVTHALAGNVVFWVGIAIAVGAIPGSFIGARLAKRTNDRTLCRFFAFFLVIMALLLALKELGILS